MCIMKQMRPERYVYKEFCRCLMDKPWKGEYALRNAYRDIERARNGYGRKPCETGRYIMTKERLGTKRLNELIELARSGGASSVAEKWRRILPGCGDGMPD